MKNLHFCRCRKCNTLASGLVLQVAFPNAKYHINQDGFVDYICDQLYVAFQLH